MWTDISESAVIMDSEALVYLETWMCVGFWWHDIHSIQLYIHTTMI